MLFGQTIRYVSLGVLGSRKICHPQVVPAKVPNFGLTLLHLAGHVLSKSFDHSRTAENYWHEQDKDDPARANEPEAFLFDWQVSRCRLVHCLKGLNKACVNHSFGSAILQVAQVTSTRRGTIVSTSPQKSITLGLERAQSERKSGLRPGTVPSACGHRTFESYISGSWILQVKPLKERMKIGQVISQIKTPTLVSKGGPLPETNSSPLKIGNPQKEMSSSNHPFSGLYRDTLQGTNISHIPPLEKGNLSCLAMWGAMLVPRRVLKLPMKWELDSSQTRSAWNLYFLFVALGSIYLKLVTWKKTQSCRKIHRTLLSHLKNMHKSHCIISPNKVEHWTLKKRWNINHPARKW